MNTVGPAISLRTSCWLFPQKEQYSVLFESPPGPFAERLARGASGLVLLQVLDAEDVTPSGGAGARLTDSESGEVLERVLTPGVVAQYEARLRAHVGLWEAAARRVRAAWVQAVADQSLAALARSALSPLVEFA